MPEHHVEDSRRGIATQAGGDRRTPPPVPPGPPKPGPDAEGPYEGLDLAREFYDALGFRWRDERLTWQGQFLAAVGTVIVPRLAALRHQVAALTADREEALGRLRKAERDRDAAREGWRACYQAVSEFYASGYNVVHDLLADMPEPPPAAADAIRGSGGEAAAAHRRGLDDLEDLAERRAILGARTALRARAILARHGGRLDAADALEQAERGLRSGEWRDLAEEVAGPDRQERRKRHQVRPQLAEDLGEGVAP